MKITLLDLFIIFITAHYRCAGLLVPAGIPDPTRTSGYGSGTGRCLTGRVGSGRGTKSTGKDIPVLPVKTPFSRRWSYIECFFFISYF